jgi:hypothetical protein
MWEKRGRTTESYVRGARSALDCDGCAATQEGFTTEAQRSRSPDADKNCGSTNWGTVYLTSPSRGIFLRDLCNAIP